MQGESMFLGGCRSDLIVILYVQNQQAAEGPFAHGPLEAGSCFWKPATIEEVAFINRS